MKQLLLVAALMTCMLSASALFAQQPRGRQPNVPPSPPTSPATPQASPSPPPSPQQEAAKKEFDEGERLLNEGNLVGAQAHFERALELAPELKNARISLARAIHQQYRADDTTPENVALAHAAIEAYKRIPPDTPDGDGAYEAVAYLYRQLGETEAVREWMLARARSEAMPKEKRAAAFFVLANLQLKCAQDITEQKENKTTAKSGEATIVTYRKPKSETDFSKAMDCATDALQLIDSAIEFNAQDPRVWRHKAAILNELAKLSQMEEKPAEQSEYVRRMHEAQAEHERFDPAAKARAASAENSTPKSAGTNNNPAPARNRAPAPSGGTRLVSGGMLNSKAVHNPTPPYPDEAKAARASGAVAVQIVFDETGKVVEATVLSGHPLLRDAALTAARNARFVPVKIAGQPVKVRGVITYNFALQ